jgi:hypothetical protein
MSEHPLDLTISLGDNVDEEELDLLTRELRDEIAELGVERVGLAPGTALPPGAKGDPVSVGTIIISLASTGVLTALIELVKSWALRREGRSVKFKAKVADREVELTYNPDDTTPEEMSKFGSKVVAAMQPKASKKP